jgi:hypothetical protein
MNNNFDYSANNQEADKESIALSFCVVMKSAQEIFDACKWFELTKESRAKVVSWVIRNYILCG